MRVTLEVVHCDIYFERNGRFYAAVCPVAVFLPLGDLRGPGDLAARYFGHASVLGSLADRSVAGLGEFLEI